MTVDEEIAVEDWLMRDFDPDNLAILRDEEEEPDFSAIIKKAQDRCKQYHCEDAALIHDLIGIIQHYDNTLHSYYWSMSDNSELPHGA